MYGSLNRKIRRLPDVQIFLLFDEEVVGGSAPASVVCLYTRERPFWKSQAADMNGNDVRKVEMTAPIPVSRKLQQTAGTHADGCAIATVTRIFIR